MQATGKAEKQVDKASDKVGSAAKEVSHGTWLFVLAWIPDECTQPHNGHISCNAQALSRPVHNFKFYQSIQHVPGHLLPGHAMFGRF